MASHKHSTNLLDIQNDDSEINLQFQDFEGTDTSHGRDDLNKEHTIYFNSFPDSAEDDQEQKLLGDDDVDTVTKSTHSFWTFEYYQQFFDVESKQVVDRIVWSMVPKPGVNFLQSYIRPNPDLYGPFWICITLIFTTAIAGNLSNYLQSIQSYHWRYDFHKVTLATSSIFSYAWLVPLLIWAVLLWRGSKANISLLELICLYGYSLAVFVPVSLLWMIPLRWLQWCLGIVAAVLSGSVLVRTIQPAISHESKKVAFGLAVLILLLHAALALGFMLYFFYPPTINTLPVTETAPLDMPKGPDLPVGPEGIQADKNLNGSKVGKEEKDNPLKEKRADSKLQEQIPPKVPIVHVAPKDISVPKALPLRSQISTSDNVPVGPTVPKKEILTKYVNAEEKPTKKVIEKKETNINIKDKIKTKPLVETKQNETENLKKETTTNLNSTVKS